MNPPIVVAVVVLAIIMGVIVWRSLKLGTFRAVVSDLLWLLTH